MLHADEEEAVLRVRGGMQIFAKTSITLATEMSDTIDFEQAKVQDDNCLEVQGHGQVLRRWFGGWRPDG